jgi:hypothetical protein
MSQIILSLVSFDFSQKRSNGDHLFVTRSFRPNPSIKMGGTDRCGILFYAGSTTSGIGLLLVAPAPLF